MARKQLLCSRRSGQSLAEYTLLLALVGVLVLVVLLALEAALQRSYERARNVMTNANATAAT